MTSQLSAESLLKTVRDLCAIGARRPATPADTKTQEYLVQAMREAGLQRVRREPVHFHLWEPQERSLVVETKDGRLALDTEPLHLSAFSDRGGVRADLVDVGRGEEEDFARVDVAGKIVLADITYGVIGYEVLMQLGFFAYDPDGLLAGQSQPTTWLADSEQRIVRLAREKGAAAVVLVFPFAMRPFLYYPEADPMTGEFGSLPALVVTRPEGTRLRAAMDGRQRKATFVSAGQVSPGLTYNVVGEIPGQTDEVILVGSHHDSMWEGATEDAAGCAAVLGLARHFAAFPPGSLRHTLVFNLDAAEQIRVLGGRTFVETHREDLLRRLLVEVHIEHIAWEVFEDETGRVQFTGHLQPRALFVADDPRFQRLAQEMIQQHDLRRTVALRTDTPLGVPTDATPYAEAGYPVISFISAPIYWNTDADTLDKVPGAELERVTRAFADLVEKLDRL